MKLQRNYSTRNKCLAVSGFAASLSGLTLLFARVWLIEILTRSILVLKPNTYIESIWRNITDMPSNVHLFNWANHEDFQNKSAKLKFQEIGPYKYDQAREKVDVVWNDNNTVTYTPIRHIYFDEKATAKNLSVTATTINGVSVCFATYAKNQNFLVKKIFSTYLLATAPEVHMTRTIRQYLLDGIDDFILTMGNHFPFIAPEIPRFEKFTLTSIVNESKIFEGTLNIDTGVDGSFEVRNWNYQNVTPQFSGSCSNVHGSPGDIYRRHQSKDYIDIFLSIICRHVRLKFEKEVMVDGILGYKYSVGNEALDNGTLVPENACYCEGECIPSGLVNITSCKHGFPLFASLPHFYLADPVYLDMLEGFQPEKAKHESYIVIEPNTGIPLKAVERVQFNILVQPIEDISVFEDVRKVFFPLFWLEIKSSLPESANLLLKIYLMLPRILIGIASCITALGFILIIVSCKPLLHRSEESKQPEEIPLRSSPDNQTSSIKCSDKNGIIT